MRSYSRHSADAKSIVEPLQQAVPCLCYVGASRQLPYPWPMPRDDVVGMSGPPAPRRSSGATTATFRVLAFPDVRAGGSCASLCSFPVPTVSGDVKSGYQTRGLGSLDGFKQGLRTNVCQQILNSSVTSLLQLDSLAKNPHQRYGYWDVSRYSHPTPSLPSARAFLILYDCTSDDEVELSPFNPYCAFLENPAFSDLDFQANNR